MMFILDEDSDPKRISTGIQIQLDPEWQLSLTGMKSASEMVCLGKEEIVGVYGSFW